MITLTNATPKAVRYACMMFHYAKTVPSAQYSFCVYNEAGEWCGCIIFGGGATPNIGKPFGLVQGEILELVRVALNGKQPCTSECVAAALKKLHKDAPQVKMVVSYADMDMRHFGTIYQATNWIYLGESNTGGKGYYIINGKRTHPKTCYANGWKQSLAWLQANVDPKAIEVKTAGKRKYIYCFDRKMRKEWTARALPYPKAEQ